MIDFGIALLIVLILLLLVYVSYSIARIAMAAEAIYERMKVMDDRLVEIEKSSAKVAGWSL